MNKNQFNPNMIVSIVDLTENVPPRVLHVTEATSGKLLTFEPNFDRFSGDPAYDVPRNYAARLLENAGGRRFRLTNPNSLLIQVSNGRGGKDWQKIVAWKKTASGEWVEKTEEEIGEDTTSTISPELETALLRNEPMKSKEKRSKKALSKAPESSEGAEGANGRPEYVQADSAESAQE